ncbi:Protein psbN [Thalassoporum mexicanum PCC 7367]|nr:photosystem II reaction center protein PsbN [Pseudanabaena sp. PCC 7367]AFY70237.1 Protein psbN [Pseudanabaena sp. PCC 7367]
MENATSLILTIATIVVCITALAIYTSFGPPNKELADPFEDHED